MGSQMPQVQPQRETKAQSMETSLQNFARVIQQAKDLECEILNGSSEPPPTVGTLDKDQIPTTAVMLADAPDRINRMSEEIRETLNRIREMII